MMTRDDSAKSEWLGMVEAARAGDLEAFGGLVRRFQDMAVAYAYSVLADFDKAEDAAQEAFIMAYRDLPTLQQPRAFPSWFRRIVFTKCSRQMRGKRLTMVPLDEVLDVPSSAPNPAKAAQQREMQDRVLAAVRALPEREREVTSLFYINGYSMAEVGEFLDVPISTIKKRLHSARAKLRERMTDMVENTLKQNGPGEEFSERVVKMLTDVPVLDWGSGKVCTYIGALEAVMTMTEHPWVYEDLMGVSGMAFRLRWSNRNLQNKWCPSCVIAELPEETEALKKATGWSLPTDVWHFEPDHKMIWDRVTASIDAGKPVVSYSDVWDMAVIHGYDKQSRSFFLRDYHRGNIPFSLPIEKTVCFMQVYLGDYKRPPSQSDVLMESLKIAVNNWHRGMSDGAIPGRQYLYGELALTTWISDLERANRAEFAPADMKPFHYLNNWVFLNHCDARRCAVDYLDSHAHSLNGEKRNAIKQAAAIYGEELKMLQSREENAFGHPFKTPFEDWTPPVREREREILTKAWELEKRAVAELEKALLP